MTPSDTAHPEGERAALIERLRAWPDSPDRRDDYSVKSIQALMNEAALALLSPPSRPQGEEGLAEAQIIDALAVAHSEMMAKRVKMGFRQTDWRPLYPDEIARCVLALSNQGKPSS